MRLKHCVRGGFLIPINIHKWTCGACSFNLLQNCHYRHPTVGRVLAQSWAWCCSVARANFFSTSSTLIEFVILWIKLSDWYQRDFHVEAGERSFARCGCKSANYRRRRRETVNCSILFLIWRSSRLITSTVTWLVACNEAIMLFYYYRKQRGTPDVTYHSHHSNALKTKWLR